MLACIPNCNPNTTQHRKDLEPISALQYLNAGSCLNTVVLSTIIDWGMAILQLGSEHHLHKHFQNESVGLMQPSGIPALSRTKHMAYSHRCHAKLTRQRDLCLGMVWWWVKPSICKPTRVTVQDALARSQCTRHTNHFRSVLAEWCWQLIAKDLPQVAHKPQNWTELASLLKHTSAAGLVCSSAPTATRLALQDLPSRNLKTQATLCTVLAITCYT